MLRVCIYSLRYPACIAHAPYFHLWTARLYGNVPRYLINSTILEKNVIEYITCVWTLFTTFVRNISHSKKKLLRYDHKGAEVFMEVPIILVRFNPLKPELNPICYLLALLGAHHFLHVSRIRVKLLTFRRLMLYIYGAPILDVSRSHTTTQHSR